MSFKDRLDPELLAGYELFESMNLLDDIKPETIVATRQKLRDVFVSLRAKLPKVEGVTWNEREIARGDSKICVRVYRSEATEPKKPCLVWIHGGGMILGTIDTDDVICSTYASRLGCVVVSVDYRLAPEFPHPTPVEDCHAGLAWAAANAEELGIDASRLVIAGSSAGAGLAAATALYARDHGGPKLAFQCLIYPMLDDRNQTPSSKEFQSIASWSGKSNITGWNALLRGRAGAADIPIYAAPARAENLAGLPPALVQVGELEVFRDEDVDYALRMLRAGVPVELHVYPGAVHASDTFAPTSRVGKKMIEDRMAALAHAMRLR